MHEVVSSDLSDSGSRATQNPTAKSQLTLSHGNPCLRKAMLSRGMGGSAAKMVEASSGAPGDDFAASQPMPGEQGDPGLQLQRCVPKDPQ